MKGCGSLTGLFGVLWTVRLLMFWKVWERPLTYLTCKLLGCVTPYSYWTESNPNWSPYLSWGNGRKVDTAEQYDRYVCVVVVVVVVVNFDALAQASNFRIESRQVAFLCWMQDSNQGPSQEPNLQQTECPLTNRLSYRGSGQKLVISEHSVHSNPLPVGFRTWLWWYNVTCLLLISMLWHGQGRTMYHQLYVDQEGQAEYFCSKGTFESRVSIGSGNGLLPHGTTLLTEPTLTFH